MVVFRLIGLAISAIAALILAAMQIGPSDAKTNLAAWWEALSGNAPGWLNQPNANGSIAAIAFIALAAGALLFILPWLSRSRSLVIIGDSEATEYGQIYVPVRVRRGVVEGVRVTMTLVRLSGIRLRPSFVLLSEQQISRGRPHIGRVALDDVSKPFQLFTYASRERRLHIAAEGGTTTVPAEDYNIIFTVAGAGPAVHRYFTLRFEDLNLRFSDGTANGVRTIIVGESQKPRSLPDTAAT
jgi:hypothetical protein